MPAKNPRINVVLDDTIYARVRFLAENRKMIRKAIEERLMTEPERYGKKLQRTLKDYWKLRVGQYVSFSK
jgi:mRNA-degrading endonuclease RelE of RelBE toxin-antitoxin system